MRFNIGIILTAITLGNFEVSAESRALQERGASCTDYCTVDGNLVTEDLILMGFQRHDIGTNISTMKEKAEFINQHCKILNEIEKNDAANAINYNWCEANCMTKGSVLSRIKGRLEKVKSYVDKRRTFCKETMEKYEEVFQEFVSYDRERNMLVFK